MLNQDSSTGESRCFKQDEKINKLIFPQWNDVPWEKHCCLCQPGQESAAQWDVLCRERSCSGQTLIFHVSVPSTILSFLQQHAKLAEAVGGEIPSRILLSIALKKYYPSQETAGGRMAAGEEWAKLTQKLGCGISQHSPAPLGLRRSTACSLRTGTKEVSTPNPPPVASHGERGESSEKYLDAFRQG